MQPRTECTNQNAHNDGTASQPQPVVTSVLIGASRPEQILDNIKAVENTTFTPDELAELDRICAME